MSSQLVERRVRCPYCDEQIDILIDLSAGSQSYVEDCQVCCQPIELGFETDGADLLGVMVDRAG